MEPSKYADSCTTKFDVEVCRRPEEVSVVDHVSLFRLNIKRERKGRRQMPLLQAAAGQDVFQTECLMEVIP
jgi:hypothetical protein